MSYIYIYIYIYTHTYTHTHTHTHGAPILDVSRSHTTQHSLQDSSRRVISSSQRPLLDNTRHNRQISMPPVGFEPTISAGVRPLICWDRGFECHRGHGYLFVVSVVCCQVEVSATSWSLVQRSPTDCAASLCDLETSRMGVPYIYDISRLRVKPRFSIDYTRPAQPFICLYYTSVVSQN